ncbi:relaxase/mobilization nuclease domain-containing protein, partial [Salmonella enterica]
NQYSILWVEHQDKGRLELNFVIPNMELQTGKRLQPYYDRADRP